MSVFSAFILFSLHVHEKRIFQFLQLFANRPLALFAVLFFVSHLSYSQFPLVGKFPIDLAMFLSFSFSYSVNSRKTVEKDLEVCENLRRILKMP